VKFLEPWALILILVIVLIIFGPKRLPGLGKSMRKGMRSFKDEVEPGDKDQPDKREDGPPPSDKGPGGTP